MAKQNERKERVIHTRISGSLDDELKDKASQLGVSVSNLVRNVLQNTFGLVDGIVADSAQVARSARGGMANVGAQSSSAAANAGSAQTPHGGEPQILGWQPLVLNVNAICVTCNSILPKGTEAAVAITDAPGARPMLCNSCLEELSNDDGATS